MVQAVSNSNNMSSSQSSPGGNDAAKKSGIKVLQAGENLFHENDLASSLFIIQKGQIRLFRPKGRGFVELAILRAGEVIGEMAFFDDAAKKRSCSAEAIIYTEIIEISFEAFSKAMDKLNPWFKTIVNTLVKRLKKSNDTVKSLESNSISYGRDGKVSNYKFFTNLDVARALSTFYLVAKAHGEVKGMQMAIHMNMLKFYMFDIYNFPEIKFEEVMNLFRELEMIELKEDKEGLLNEIRINKLEDFKSLMKFFNNQRHAGEDDELMISAKCERFLKRIYDQVDAERSTQKIVEADLSEILADFKHRNIPIDEEDLKDAIEAGYVGEIIVGHNNQLICDVEIQKLRENFPIIVMVNKIKKVNEAKSKV
ncbi:MAG: hypothetical protein A2202_02305 [Bdellovibrionales bacterium RIFOXYA1_FULL_36_14]|nr:MAG: hypothetical protein A2202_02305 [Bdellovibrionales bacterium RIFOXYA1_FULL_36_14]